MKEKTAIYIYENRKYTYNIKFNDFKKESS